MKKNHKTKLAVKSETIRTLTDTELKHVAGGLPPTSHINGSYCCSEGNSACGSACTFCACGALTTTCTQYQC